MYERSSYIFGLNICYRMQLPSEIEARYLLPSLRAYIAKKLILEKGYTQEKAAKAMGLTQAAVSNYLRGVRGFKIDLEGNLEISKYIEEIVEMVCNNVPAEEITKKLNELLVYIRKKGILCNLHKTVEPILNTKKCGVCKE